MRALGRTRLAGSSFRLGGSAGWGIIGATTSGAGFFANFLKVLARYLSVSADEWLGWRR